MPLPALAAGVPILLVWFSRLIFSRLGAWVVGALVFLGMYLGTQNLVVEPLLDQVLALGTGAATGTVGEWIAFLQFDKAITMLISAYTASFAVSSAKVALYKR